jgi:hypothetical protein
MKEEEKMADGIIEIDSDRAKEFGFTSDRFTKASYLWKCGNRIWISFIESKVRNRGYFKELVKAIKNKGYEVAVPTPIGIMQIIVRKWGFRQVFEQIKIGEENVVCEVWLR